MIFSSLNFYGTNRLFGPMEIFISTKKRIFSFFSHVHSSYSRIDYFYIDFYIDKTLLPSLEKTQYSAIIISDHAPLLLDLRFTLCSNQRPTWRLNPTLLADKKCILYISTTIYIFLATNTLDEVSPSTLWETFKVVIRGEIISYSSYTNKIKNAKLQQLIDSIAKVDRDVSLTPTEELFKKRVELKAQYDQLSIERTQQYLLWSKGNFYEHGEKAGRLLAHKIKCQSTSRLIPQI